MKTRRCDPAVTSGRRSKAEQFAAAAELVHADESMRSAYVSNCVLAGIAAADVLCCLALGHHAQGDDHSEAISLISRVPDGKRLAKALSTLLAMKSRASYAAQDVSADHCKRAGRAMQTLLHAMRDR